MADRAVDVVSGGGTMSEKLIRTLNIKAEGELELAPRLPV